MGHVRGAALGLNSFWLGRKAKGTRRSWGALVLLNAGQVAVLVAGETGAIGDGSMTGLILLAPDASKLLLTSGAQVVARFSNAPIDEATASAMAVLDDVRPPGIELERETILFEPKADQT